MTRCVDVMLIISFLGNKPIKIDVPKWNTSQFKRDGGSTTHSSQEDVVRLVNSRYIKIAVIVCEIPSSIKQLWNLHTLIGFCGDVCTAPIEIWKMHQLRHVNFVRGRVYLPDPPPSNDNDIVILENLQTLKGVDDLNLNEEVVRRIPNIKTLKIWYDKKLKERAMCLSYLHCLSKLEIFQCYTDIGCHEYLRNITFPNSLKSLTLGTLSGFEVDGILKEIGALPLLHKLVLVSGSFKSGKWEITQGQFKRLRSLKLWDCDLQEWIVLESSCFPCLRVLYLDELEKLNEIPLEIGEIPTLKSITLARCSETAVLSAKKIVEEQEDLQGEQLDFRVIAVVENGALESLASPNFEVRQY